jgi:hypothetical protein
LFQTSAEGAATLRLPIRDNAAHPVQAQRQTLRNREGRFDTITAVAITQADAEGQPTIPTAPETEEHLCEVVATIFARPIRRGGRIETLRLVRLRPVEHKGRGVLRQPGRRDGLDL